MKISHIKISNILGIEELEFSPGGFTSIEGPNGTGKTSILEAIKAALQPGHDATLLRNGADKGEVVFVLEDGMQISKKVGANTSSTDVRGADGKKIARPAETIARLTDMFSINPIDFLTAKKQERVKVLLETMPLKIDCAELSRVSGVKVNAQSGLHALLVIEMVRKQVYDDRTGTNRAIKEKEATINQIRLAMPDEVASVQGSEDELQLQLDTATNEFNAEKLRISTKLAGLRDENFDKVVEIKNELAEAIEALREEAQTKINDIATAFNKTDLLAGLQSEKNVQKYTERTEPVRISLANIRANRSSVAKREQAIDTIKQMDEELTGIIADAARQTQSIEAIDKYKSDLLSDLPIPGLEVRDGDIYQGGVPLERLNTAAQVNIAVQVARLRAGDLGVVCVDRVESLDSETLAHFKDAIADSGLQLFITRVSDGEFTVNTD